jgi:hypothetical protein
MYQFRSQRTSIDEPGRHRYLCPNEQVVLCTFSMWQAGVIGIKQCISTNCDLRS